MRHPRHVFRPVHQRHRVRPAIGWLQLRHRLLCPRPDLRIHLRHVHRHLPPRHPRRTHARRGRRRGKHHHRVLKYHLHVPTGHPTALVALRDRVRRRGLQVCRPRGLPRPRAHQRAPDVHLPRPPRRPVPRRVLGLGRDAIWKRDPRVVRPVCRCQHLPPPTRSGPRIRP